MQKPIAVVALVVLGIMSQVRPAAAQELRGFASAGMTSDLNSRYPALAAGIVMDLPTSWLSAGAQAEVFTSWPYVAGRGAAFGQVNLTRRRALRPFLMAGYGGGETTGPLLGGGMEVRFPGRRLGVRATVEDYLVRVDGFDCVTLGYSQSYCDANLEGGRAHTKHQVALRVGLLF